MKKLIAILIVTSIALLGIWSWIYGSYVKIQNGIVEKCETGNWVGAMERLRRYQESKSSYLIYNLPYFKKFRLRLTYNEGVINGNLGDSDASERAFRDAALSREIEIAEASLYNLALLATGRGDVESAGAHLSSALRLIPGDVDAKVNLELVLKRMKVPVMEQPRGEGKQRKNGLPPVEQWRDLPSYEEGPGDSKSRRSYL